MNKTSLILGAVIIVTTLVVISSLATPVEDTYQFEKVAGAKIKITRSVCNETFTECKVTTETLPISEIQARLSQLEIVVQQTGNQNIKKVYDLYIESLKAK